MIHHAAPGHDVTELLDESGNIQLACSCNWRAGYLDFVLDDNEKPSPAVITRYIEEHVKRSNQLERDRIFDLPDYDAPKPVILPENSTE
jgi:hypothetical protein